jgi:hypothetical protein
MNLPTKEQRVSIPDKPEKISELEKLMINISGYLSELSELKPVFEESISLKNDSNKNLLQEFRTLIGTMTDHFDELKENLECEVKYSRELALKGELYEKKHEISILESKLIETESRIDVFINDVKKFMTEKINNMDETVKNLKSEDEKIEESISRFNEKASSAAISEYSILKSQSENLLKSFTKKCQEDLEILKKKSIDFLKECEAQNKEIIGRIPKVNTNKYSLKDILLFIVSGLGIVSFIMNLLKI